MRTRKKKLTGHDLLRGVASALLFVADAGAASLVPGEHVEGVIQDLSAERVLYLAPDQTLVIADRATGARTTIPGIASRVPLYGFLDPGGAVFVAMGESALDVGIYAYADNTLTQLGSPDSWSSLKVSGPYALWSGGTTMTMDPGNRDILSLYNLQTHTGQMVSNTAGNWANAVTNTGVVTYWDSRYGLNRYSDGTTVSLAPATAGWNALVASDGQMAAFRRQDACCVDQQYQIILNLGSEEIPLTPRSSFEPVVGANYQVKGGWVAYTAADGNGVQQAWLRSPGGLSTQLTQGAQPARLDQLSEGGRLTYLVGDSLFLAGDSTALQDSYGNEDRSFWINEVLVVTHGGTVYQLNSDELPLRPLAAAAPVPLPAAFQLLASALGVLGLGRPAWLKVSGHADAREH